MALKQTWLWEDFKYPYTSAYFKDRQGSQQLSQLVPDAYELVWFLIDEPKLSGFPIYEATTTAIEKVVIECNIFRYYIIAKDLSWLIGENDYHMIFAIGENVEKNLKELEPNLFEMMNWNKEDVTPLNVLAELVSETHQPIITIKGFSQVLLKLNYSSEEERLSHTQIILERASFLESIMEAAKKYLVEYRNQSEG